MDRIKNYTYRNLMIVINAILRKGYDLSEAEQIAKAIFRDFQPDRGQTIARRVEVVLTKEEYLREFSDANTVSCRN